MVGKKQLSSGFIVYSCNRCSLFLNILSCIQTSHTFMGIVYLKHCEIGFLLNFCSSNLKNKYHLWCFFHCSLVLLHQTITLVPYLHLLSYFFWGCSTRENADKIAYVLSNHKVSKISFQLGKARQKYPQTKYKRIVEYIEQWIQCFE